MKTLDRIMLGGLVVAILFTLCMLGVIYQRVLEAEGTTTVDIRESGVTTTVPPAQPCVVVADGTDTNWAARFGVADGGTCT